MEGKRVISVAALLLAFGLMSGCSGSAEATSVTPIGYEVLATIEGAWLCDVQRFAFDDLGEIDARLDARLDADGFDRDDYETFKSEIDEHPGLRQLVLDTFHEACPA